MVYIPPEVQSLVKDVIISLIYLLGSFVIGNVLSKKIQEYLNRLINVRIIKAHIKEEKSVERVIDFISLFVKYFIFLLGWVLALNQLKIELVSRLVYGLIDYTPNLIAALLFIVIGIMLANLSKRIIRISLSATGIDELFSDLEPKLLPSNFFAIMVQYLVLVIAITVALSQLGLQTQLLSWLALSITTIMILFMFIFAYSAMKPYLPDLVAGVIIRNRRYLRVGEYIKLDNEKYRVMGIGVIHTKLERNGELRVVKNSEIITKFRRKI